MESLLNQKPYENPRFLKVFPKAKRFSFLRKKENCFPHTFTQLFPTFKSKPASLGLSARHGGTQNPTSPRRLPFHVPPYLWNFAEKIYSFAVITVRPINPPNQIPQSRRRRRRPLGSRLRPTIRHAKRNFAMLSTCRRIPQRNDPSPSTPKNAFDLSLSPCGARTTSSREPTKILPNRSSPQQNLSTSPSTTWRRQSTSPHKDLLHQNGDRHHQVSLSWHHHLRNPPRLHPSSSSATASLDSIAQSSPRARDPPAGSSSGLRHHGHAATVFRPRSHLFPRR